MVGLNHEFARELLWREYPTDQRGSYFRQFWDVRGYPRPDASRTPRRCARSCATSRRCTAGRAPRSSATTTTASVPGEKEEEVVLVIRGELLKKYPTAVDLRPARALAARDRTATDPTSTHGARTLERRSTPTPRRTTRRAPRCSTPLYEAKVDPDIYFFGFDLTAEEAQRRHAASPATRTRAGSS